jgi:2-(1,2-epoxy-1,2-dihydrophenyl)acetyl-CoA isomerase
MDNTQEILFDSSDGIGTITLNRPDKLNAMTIEMYEEIVRLCIQIRRDDEVKVLVITGNGRAFCSGSDIEKRLLPRMKEGHHMPVEESRADLLEPVVMLKLAPALYNLGKPTIAAVNGVAAGAGLALATLCDFRIASDKARFIASWVNIGLTPGVGATYTLPRLIGLDQALKMIYTRQPVEALDAERIRLVTQVVPDDDLMSTVRSFATIIANGPSVAFELARKALHRGITNDLTSQLYFEVYSQGVCFMSEDFKEGVKAFLEKRKPLYRGR